MKALTIPSRVLVALKAGNPYQVIWETAAAHATFQNAEGPAKAVAERLVEALQGFPPPTKDFDIIDIRESLSAAGFKVTVGTGTHIRVTVIATYREAQRVVCIQDLQMSARRPEKLKRIQPDRAGDKP